MSISIRITADTLSPALRRGVAACADLSPVWLAVGTEIVGITGRAFTDASMRIAPWASKYDGTPSSLIRKGMLRSSIRVVSVDSSGVKVGSDRIYAAIHQMGGVIRPKTKKALVFTVGGVTIRAKKVTIPARPFFPFTTDGQLAPQHRDSVLKVMRLALTKHVAA